MAFSDVFYDFYDTSVLFTVAKVYGYQTFCVIKSALEFYKTNQAR